MRYRILFMLAMVLSLHARAEENPVVIRVVAQPFAFAKGDQWLYKTRDLIREADVDAALSAVTEVAEGKAWVLLQGRGRGWEVFDNALGRVIERRTYDESYENKRGRIIESYSLNPEGNDVQFPLQVGREYKVEYDKDATINEYRNGFLSSQRREPAHYNLTATIEAIEKVSTRLGEFDAYKIHLRGRMHQQSLSEAPLIEKIIWWSPVIKREVVIEFKEWDSRPREQTAAGMSRIERPAIHTRTELVDFRLAPNG